MFKFPSSCSSSLLDTKATYDLPTAASRNLPIPKPKINIHLSANDGTESNCIKCGIQEELSLGTR